MDGRPALAVAGVALVVAGVALVRTLPPAPTPVVSVAPPAPLDSGEDAAAEAEGPAPTAEAPGATQVSPGPTMDRLSSHFAAVWYAAKAGNTELAGYSLTEMGEAARALEGRRRLGRTLDPHTRLSRPLDSMKRALGRGDWEGFDRAYHSTIDACNRCHDDNGVPIEIVVPEEPPVSNRRWAPS